MKPMKEAATEASSTTAQRRLRGWRAPTSAHAQPGHEIAPLSGEGRGVRPGLGGLVTGRETPGVGQRDAALGVGVDGVLDLRDARALARDALDRQRQVDLALGRPVAQLLRRQAL